MPRTVAYILGQGQKPEHLIKPVEYDVDGEEVRAAPRRATSWPSKELSWRLEAGHGARPGAVRGGLRVPLVEQGERVVLYGWTGVYRIWMERTGEPAPRPLLGRRSRRAR